MLKETRPDHAISSAVTASRITAMLHQPQEEEELQEGECVVVVFKYIVLYFLTFQLSCYK